MGRYHQIGAEWRPCRSSKHRSWRNLATHSKQDRLLDETVPRFFIDTSDQARFVRDEEGLQFDDVEAAMNAAAGGLSEMAYDVLPGGESRTFLAIVRDAQGRTLVQTSMSFGVVWMPGGR